jgi:hypothetical protein
MIDGKTLPEGEPVYTYVADDGTNTVIHAERLRQYLKRHPQEVFLTPVDREMAKGFLEHNVVSLSRVYQLMTKKRLDPIILCKRPTYTDGRPDVYLVDGHHRYVLTALAKSKFIPAVLVEIRVWRKFQVINLPLVTQTILTRTPVTERNY